MGLFNFIDRLPVSVQAIIAKYDYSVGDKLGAKECEDFKKELELNGYTFDYDKKYLEPYDLRKLSKL